MGKVVHAGVAVWARKLSVAGGCLSAVMVALLVAGA